MRKLKRVVLLVLALVLALAPMCLAAETALTNTVWKINATVGSTKGTTILRFYDDTMFLRMGSTKGSYTYDDKTGKLVMSVMESQDKTVTINGLTGNIAVEAGMVVESFAKLNKKGTIITLSEFFLKAQIGNITPKGFFEGMPIPVQMKMTKLTPKVNKVSAAVVKLGTPSVVNIKTNEAADCFLVYDKDGAIISKGAVINGAGSFNITFTAKKNPITVKVGLLDASGKLIESKLSKAVKATIKCK